MVAPRWNPAEATATFPIDVVYLMLINRDEAVRILSAVYDAHLQRVRREAFRQQHQDGY